MDARTWKGGTHGVRVGKKNALMFFDKSWANIEVKIDGTFHVFRLSPAFWTTCPEFRGEPIPEWLKTNGLDKWPKGNPHRLILKPLGRNRFQLFLAE